MNQIATLSTNQAPPPQTREQRDLLASYLNAIEATGAGHYSISEHRAPTAIDLNRLTDRLDTLRGSLGTSDPKRVAERIIRLFLRFPSTASLASSQVEQMVAAYATDLTAFPLWAIDAACIAVTRGDSQFPPSAPTLRTKVEAAAAVVSAEIADLQKVLGAGVYREPSEAERERVNAGFEQLTKDLELNASNDRPRKDSWPLSKEQAEVRLDHLATLPVPRLSSEALARFGIQDRVSIRTEGR